MPPTTLFWPAPAPIPSALDAARHEAVTPAALPRFAMRVLLITLLLALWGHRVDGRTVRAGRGGQQGWGRRSRRRRDGVSLKFAQVCSSLRKARLNPAAPAAAPLAPFAGGGVSSRTAVGGACRSGGARLPALCASCARRLLVPARSRQSGHMPVLPSGDGRVSPSSPAPQVTEVVLQQGGSFNLTPANRPPHTIELRGRQLLMRGAHPGGPPSYIHGGGQTGIVQVLEGGRLVQQVGGAAMLFCWLCWAGSGPARLAARATPLPCPARALAVASHCPLLPAPSPPHALQQLFVQDCILGHLPLFCFVQHGPRGHTEMHDSTLADAHCADTAASAGIRFALGVLRAAPQRRLPPVQLDARWACALVLPQQRVWAAGPAPLRVQRRAPVSPLSTPSCGCTGWPCRRVWIEDSGVMDSLERGGRAPCCAGMPQAGMLQATQPAAWTPSRLLAPATSTSTSTARPSTLLASDLTPPLQVPPGSLGM